MTETNTRARLVVAFGDLDLCERVIDAVASIAEVYDVALETGNPLLPLIALVGDIDLDTAAIAAAILDLPEDSRQIVLRIAEPDMAERPGLLPRRTGDAEDAAYLASGVNSLDFLIAVHARGEVPELAGLRALVRDPAITDADRVARMLALHPQAADLCSHVYAGGARPGETRRFYESCPGIGYDGRWQVIDRETNTVVLESKWARHCEALALTMSAFPEIGAQMSALVANHYANQPCARSVTEAYRAEWARLHDSLGAASTAWRAEGHLPLCDPWAPALPLAA